MPEASCSCPQCGARYRAEGLRPGRRLRCRKCRTVFTYHGMAEGASPAGAAEAALPAAVGDQSSLMRAGMEWAIPTLRPADPGKSPSSPGSPAAPADPERYAVEEEIARGGMGQILRAADRDLGREVAMKVMLEGMDKTARSRFVEEAQVTAQLEHPNIVPVHELGIDSEGKLFFTMKMVKGKSLSEVIRELKEGKKDDYTLGRLLNAFVNICNAMAFAHSKGVIHRDLKPANIMLGDFGEVLVMDWGLSKVMGREEAPAPAPSPPQTTPVTPKTSRFQAGGERTQDGAILGTPFYMPPEQARGHIGELDRRSDIYSLGAILYEILTLKPPVEGENLQEILIKVAKGEIKPPEERTPDRPIPRELSAIAMKALSRKPEARYPNVEDLRRDIELYLEGRAVSAKPDTAWETLVKLAKRHKGVSVTVGIATFFLLVGGLTSYWINLHARRVAELERTRAELEKRKAEERRLEADQQRKEAERQRTEAGRQAEIADRERRDAQFKLAESLISQGEALGRTGRWEEAWARYDAAEELAARVQLSPYWVEVGRWEAARHAARPIQELQVHGVVQSVAIAPNGRLALSGSSDGTLKVWEVSTGRALRTLTGHAQRVNSVAFSPDGQLAISGGTDNTVRLWEVSTGREIRTLSGHTQTVQGVAFSPDGQLVISGSFDGTIRLWEVPTGHEVRSIKARGSVFSVAISPDGHYLLSGTLMAISLLEVPTGREAWTQRSQSLFGVQSVAFSPDGKLVISADLDRTVIIRDSSTGGEKSILRGHTRPVRCAAFSPDGRLAISGSDDKTAKIWEVSTGREVRCLVASTGSLNSVAFSPDGEKVLFGGADSPLRLWEVPTGRELRTLGKHDRRVTCAAFSPDSRLAFSACEDGTLRLWDVSTGRELDILHGPRATVTSIVFSPDGRLALSGNSANEVRLWEVSTGRELRTPRGHTGGITSVAFSTDGHQALSGSRDKTVKLWEVSTGREIRTLTLTDRDQSFSTLSFSPNAQVAISGNDDKTIKLWEVSTGREIWTLDGHRVTCASFSSDGRMALLGCHDNNIRLLDVSTGREARILRGHSHHIYSVAFSIDGQLAISGSHDNTVRLWELSRGLEMMSINEHNREVLSVAFSPDGRLALSASGDHTLHLYDFSRSRRRRELELKILKAQPTLQKEPEHGESLSILGEWYAFLGLIKTAIEYMEQARKAGGAVSPLALGRCYWEKDDFSSAKREFERALALGEAPADYLKLCLKALTEAERLKGLPGK